ncbi:hypothetical protein ALC57_01550 [Trachymyrmex cornetzi]|uniref:Uncharacterized protein n=1 Tax=Trachymyrmex cornetzi TaxID=471704 RepID=A0A151JQ79_9HYME|nr:hypothetical protein ALC57_01550 [Trachymyrmex cornetzi]
MFAVIEIISKRVAIMQLTILRNIRDGSNLFPSSLVDSTDSECRYLFPGLFLTTIRPYVSTRSTANSYALLFLLILTVRGRGGVEVEHRADPDFRHLEIRPN